MLLKQYSFFKGTRKKILGPEKKSMQYGSFFFFFTGAIEFFFNDNMEVFLLRGGQYGRCYLFFFRENITSFCLNNKGFIFILLY